MGQSRPDHALVLRDFAGYGLQMYDDEEWIHEHLLFGIRAAPPFAYAEAASLPL